MSEFDDQKENVQPTRHRFHILGPENGAAFADLVAAMQELSRELNHLSYPFRKVGAIWSLQSQGRRKAASWMGLPTVLYQHAFDVAQSIPQEYSNQEWERTGSPKKLLPATWDGRWLRTSDGTIQTIDLGKFEHWTGLFNAQGNPIGRIRRRNAKAIAERPDDFAREMFNFSDVLVMEDFRWQLNDPEILLTPESAWLSLIRCDVLYRCLVQEAQITRRRLILCDPAWTSWTCPHCLNINKDHNRLVPPRIWKCPNCKQRVQRDVASCLELCRCFLTGSAITYDIARHGPAGLALKG